MPINRKLIKLVIYTQGEYYVAIKKDEEVLYRHGKIYETQKVEKTGSRLVHRVCCHLC